MTSTAWPSGKPGSSNGRADAEAIAWLLGVRPNTVRMWATRGAIDRAGTDHRGRTLYDVEQVLAVATTRGYGASCVAA